MRVLALVRVHHEGLLPVGLLYFVVRGVESDPELLVRVEAEGSQYAFHLVVPVHALHFAQERLKRRVQVTAVEELLFRRHGRRRARSVLYGPGHR